MSDEDNPLAHLTDQKAEQLLELIYIAVSEYGSCKDMQISEFAADVAMAMDETTNRADMFRRMIEQAVT